MLYAAIVTEEGLQREGNVLAVGSRAAVGTQTIFHFQRRPAVEHQFGHGIFRISSRSLAVCSGHVAPSEVSGAKAADVHAFGCMILFLYGDGVGGDIRAFGREVIVGIVVVHDLCHSGGHAARHCMLSVYRRAQVVVGTALVPAGFDERPDGRLGCASRST